jgi:hypothetical protein
MPIRAKAFLVIDRSINEINRQYRGTGCRIQLSGISTAGGTVVDAINPMPIYPPAALNQTDVIAAAAITLVILLPIRETAFSPLK